MLDLPLQSLSLQNLSLYPALKILLLIMILLYTAFTFFVYTKVRALTRIISFRPGSISNSLTKVTLFYFLIMLSLFLITLVIV